MQKYNMYLIFRQFVDICKNDLKIMKNHTALRTCRTPKVEPSTLYRFPKLQNVAKSKKRQQE